MAADDVEDAVDKASTPADQSSAEASHGGGGGGGGLLKT